MLIRKAFIYLKEYYYIIISKMEIDPRYQRGKIYKIVCNITGIRYYGSTIKTLNARLNKHEKDYKQWLKGKRKSYCKSYDIIAKGDYEIKLIRLYPCNNRSELDRKEGRYILKNKCINKNVAGRTNKEYRQQNKEKIKEYNQKNKETIKEKGKEYYQQNKETIKAHKSTIISCPCGRTYTRCNKIRHERSQFHKDNL